MSKRKRSDPARHTREFKTETVALVRTGGRSVARWPRSWTGRQPGALVGAAGRRGCRQGPAGALTTAEKEELSQLRREVKVLRMEREILKRAATFFAKENA